LIDFNPQDPEEGISSHIKIFDLISFMMIFLKIKKIKSRIKNIFSMPDLNIRIFPYTITAFISCCACVWVFYIYLTQLRKTIGFSLIIILAISDFLYSINLTLNNFFPTLKLFGFYVFTPVFFFTIFFSIIWTSAISFLVYKSLGNSSSNMSKLFVKTLITVFAISLLFIVL